MVQLDSPMICPTFLFDFLLIGLNTTWYFISSDCAWKNFGWSTKNLKKTCKKKKGQMGLMCFSANYTMLKMPIVIFAYLFNYYLRIAFCVDTCGRIVPAFAWLFNDKHIFETRAIATLIIVITIIIIRWKMGVVSGTNVSSLFLGGVVQFKVAGKAFLSGDKSDVFFISILTFCCSVLITVIFDRKLCFIFGIRSAMVNIHEKDAQNPSSWSKQERKVASNWRINTNKLSQMINFSCKTSNQTWYMYRIWAHMDINFQDMV